MNVNCGLIFIDIVEEHPGVFRLSILQSTLMNPDQHYNMILMDIIIV